MASCTNSSALLAVVLLLGSCSTLRHLVGGPQDPEHYETLQDATAQQLFDTAMVHVDAGRDAAAVPLLQQLVQRSPEFVRGHLEYQDAAKRVGGAELEQMRDYYRALPDAAASVVPAYAKARQLESTSSRLRALKEIQQRDGSFYYANFSLGRLLRSIGRLSDAVDSFRRALAYNGELLPAHLELAETLVEWGKYSEAQSHYENYLRGAPTDLAATRAFVHLLVYRLGKPHEALPWIQQLLERDA